MLNWVKYTYGEFPIYITENGVSDRNGSLQDDHRISYYRQYINNVLKGAFYLTKHIDIKISRLKPHYIFHDK